MKTFVFYLLLPCHGLCVRLRQTAPQFVALCLRTSFRALTLEHAVHAGFTGSGFLGQEYLWRMARCERAGGRYEGRGYYCVAPCERWGTII